MKRLVAFMLCVLSLGAAAQITYPYNPDGNADALIGVTDLQDLLTTYGQGFVPNEILVEGHPLSSVLASLQGQLDSLNSNSNGSESTDSYIAIDDQCSVPGAWAFNMDLGEMQVCKPTWTNWDGTEEFLLTNEIECANSVGTATNVDYWVRFQVTDTVMIGLAAFEPFTTTSFCGNVSGNLLQLYRSHTEDYFDQGGDVGELIHEGTVSDIGGRMLIPGYTYSLRSYNYGGATTRTTNIENYSVNETLFAEVKFYSAVADSFDLVESNTTWALLYNFGPSQITGNILVVYPSWSLKWSNP
jgi:hypothetical protein